MSTPSGSAEHLLFGKILIERGLITQGQLDQCLKLQSAEIDVGRSRRSLGDLMIELGFLTKQQLDHALGEQRRRLKDLVIGPYHIMDKLGSGGMGAVYRAQVPDTGVEVALKLLPKKLSADPNFLARFHREANLGMELNHPHIVRTIDFGESKGTYYIAMEVVEGGTLDHHLNVSGAIPERTALKITRDLLGALQYAHEKGLIHRDIKPSNILFDREGKSKLSDFGLAKAHEPDPQFMTQGTTVGTPHYMAPEQARGEELDIRADLYALGATLYHAVTGQTPFSGSSAAVMHSHLKRELPPPESINPNLTPGCIAIIKKLMAKDRNHRYATPAAALEDIVRLLRGEVPGAVGGGSASALVAVQVSTSQPAPAVVVAPAMTNSTTSTPTGGSAALAASTTPTGGAQRHAPRRPTAPTTVPPPRAPRNPPPPLWIVLLLISGLLWFGGIALVVWLVQDMRRSSAPASAPSTGLPAPPPARTVPKDQY